MKEINEGLFKDKYQRYKMNKVFIQSAIWFEIFINFYLGFFIGVVRSFCFTDMHLLVF